MSEVNQMLNMEDKSFFQQVLAGVKEYIGLAIGFIVLILKWQHHRINKMEDKFVSKDAFNEFKKGLFYRLDKLEENLKEDIREIKNKLK